MRCLAKRAVWQRQRIPKVLTYLLLRYKEAVGSDKSIERLMLEMNNSAVGLKCLKINMA